MDHGFDFNKQLRNGVPYLSREEERRIRETHAAEDEGRREMAPIEPSSQEFVCFFQDGGFFLEIF